MRVIPAIDLKEGRCVRLFQGDFERATEYNDDPVAVARGFAALDVAELHIVDLDGARSGAQANAGAIRRIAEVTPFAIQLGGGIRSAAVVEQWLESGVTRCVIGSLAIEDPQTVKSWIGSFGADRIVLALDVDCRDGAVPHIATHGWVRTSGTGLWDCLDDFSGAGVRHVLCTDIRRDGAMTGPNTALYAEILGRYPDIQLQASGGVRGVHDLEALKRLGIPATITGRALLDGKLSADEVASFRQSA